MASTTYNPAMAHVGLYLPKTLVAEIDKAKGCYLTRNKFMQKVIDGFLAEQQKQKELTQVLASGVAQHKE